MERREREEESREGRTEMGRRTRGKRGGKEERVKGEGEGRDRDMISTFETVNEMS